MEKSLTRTQELGAASIAHLFSLCKQLEALSKMAEAQAAGAAALN
jgi:hypothetical protein